MIHSKIRFIIQELPKIDKELLSKSEYLNRLLNEEKELNTKIAQCDSFETLERLITELNSKYQTKGQYENILNQLNSVEEKLLTLNNELSTIDDKLFSEEYAVIIQNQVNKFNLHFSSVSNELYDEKYAIKVDTKMSKGRRLYEFTAFNLNISSGKKQGEISCFDIAYILFADEENIPCMHFLMTDKKELMHDNQLVKISNLVNREGIQFIAPILKDKLPEELNKEEYIILHLSQQEKLFKIPK